MKMWRIVFTDEHRGWQAEVWFGHEMVGTLSLTHRAFRQLRTFARLAGMTTITKTNRIETDTERQRVAFFAARGTTEEEVQRWTDGEDDPPI